ncbi:hypothetical protein ACFQ36_02915 [Arthrobacter sp. GCM10027362]|uniref:hypothetical protein n=1 Tax=Arthrobacter sp. GCM10027362 TaxID=3273379 RepID=UPI003628763E
MGTLRSQLEELVEAGRIVMSRDSRNTAYRGTVAAIGLAGVGLNAAHKTMSWMETLPAGGGSPELKD